MIEHTKPIVPNNSKEWKQVFALINKCRSNLDYGWHDNEGKKIRIPKAKIENTLSLLASGKHTPHGFNNHRLQKHFEGKETIFYTSESRADCPFALVGIDIDCHSSGTYEAAVKLANDLKKLFPNLYHEPSTNGSGVHAYLLLQKQGVESHQVRHLFKNLEVFLARFHALWQAKNPTSVVQMVEVKGMPLAVDWDKGRPRVKCGSLLKLPRVGCPKDFLATTRIDKSFIHTLTSTFVHSDDSKEIKAYQGPLPQWVLDVYEFTETAPEPVVPIVSAQKPAKGRKASNCTDNFPDANIYFDDPVWLAVAKVVCPSTPSTSSRNKINHEDVAIVLAMLMRFCEDQSEDFSMPTRRFQANWRFLTGQGLLSRGWQDNKFASIRNCLSEGGWLRWVNPEFKVGTTDSKGEYHKGKAACWTAGDNLIQEVERAREVGAEAYLQEHTHYYCIDKLEEVLQENATTQETHTHYYCVNKLGEVILQDNQTTCVKPKLVNGYQLPHEDYRHLDDIEPEDAFFLEEEDNQPFQWSGKPLDEAFFDDNHDLVSQ